MNNWKLKLAAYLHDPPSKALDIRNHGERSDSTFHSAGFLDAEIGNYFAFADHSAAATDRLPFPVSRSAKISCVFDGVKNAFRHPLCGQTMPFHAEFKSASLGVEAEQTTQPTINSDRLTALGDDQEQWRARFFAHWRLWPKHAAQTDYRHALLPADTRIPDHTIWNHMQVVSALAGCADERGETLQPAFLKFQLGPVQEFIAAARSTRDLWSGSYLLSWLMAAGLKALSEEIGPDAIIYPNLRNQPLFDLHWKRELWERVSIGSTTSVWDSLYPRDRADDRDLLTPNLPNVFLAIVPANQAAELGRRVAAAIKAEWERIAAAVWQFCSESNLTNDEGGITTADRQHRFNAQIGRFLSLSWQTTNWPLTLKDALKLADGFAADMPIAQARDRVLAVVDMAEKQMPQEHRDPRYYLGGQDGPKEKLNNIGLGWSVLLALNSWELDAVRQTRAFTATNSGGWQVGAFSNKDALTGRDEAVAGGTEWAQRAKSHGGPLANLFKHPDWLSASTLVKRLWHIAYLRQSPWNLDTSKEGFPMPNTRGIARHEPEIDCSDDETAEDAPPEEKYFAVLALDGDEVGKWVSGEKTPHFNKILADYRDATGNQRFGVQEYFDQPAFQSFLTKQRPLSASYHLQFSESLTNFALYCARPIVEAFAGRLIYAGGDDVLALLPADSALDCAQALRLAYQGSPGLEAFLKANAAGYPKPQAGKVPTPQLKVASTIRQGHVESHQGFLVRTEDASLDSAERHFSDKAGHPIPFLVPGPSADCSVGIASAHFKAPLQDVVRAAQTAEKQAKSKLGRSAVAIKLMKRSGEMIEWGAQWDSGGLDLYRAVAQALAKGQLSGKFPYRVVELI